MPFASSLDRKTAGQRHCSVINKSPRRVHDPKSVGSIYLPCFALAFSQATTPAKTMYILAGRLFDATNESVRENQVVVIEGERIKTVGSAASVKIPAGATVVDLSKATVLPGLIDCHTHLGSRSDRIR